MQVRQSGDCRGRGILKQENTGRGRNGGGRATGYAGRAMRRIRTALVVGHGIICVVPVLGAVVVLSGRPSGVVVADGHANPGRHSRRTLQRDGERQRKGDQQAEIFDGHQFRILPQQFDA